MPETRAPHTGPADFSELAFSLVERMTGEAEAEDDTPESPKAVAGRKGGKARAAALSAAERSAIARQGAAARRQRKTA